MGLRSELLGKHHLSTSCRSIMTENLERGMRQDFIIINRRAKPRFSDGNDKESGGMDKRLEFRQFTCTSEASSIPQTNRD